MVKVKRKDVEVLSYVLEGGKVATFMLTGYGIDGVVLNQEDKIGNMRAGDICRIGGSLEIAMIIGFSNDNNSNDHTSLLTRAWIMPRKKTQTFCGLGYHLVRYPGDYFDLMNIEIIKKTRSPLSYETTKRRILRFLNSNDEVY